jgi:signal transduction histidine kinase
MLNQPPAMEPETLKILMLEDLEEDAGLIDRVLKKENIKFLRARVDTRDEFIQALEDFDPDVILSDHSLPQFNSIEALEICKARKLFAPFILVTGAVSEEFAVNCLKRGADDYVLKTNLSRLPQAIIQALRKHWAERNRLVQEDALRKQNEELIKINKEMDAFVYRVSHDLRSPLSSVLGLVNVARIDGVNNDQAGQYFEMIETSVLKLDETLKGILDYYKNARGELVVSEVNLAEIVHQSFEQLKFSKGFDAVKKEITFQQQTEFYSDEYRVSVVVSNLISNALKYFDNMKPERLIEVMVTINQNQAIIEVKDNGIGIPADSMVKIFDMFYRASERSQGAGLGLYIVKEMIERLQGSITVDSILGQQTLFRASIPNLKPT